MKHADYYEIDQFKFHAVLNPIHDICKVPLNFITDDELECSLCNGMILTSDLLWKHTVPERVYILLDIPSLCQEFERYIKNSKSRNKYHDVSEILNGCMDDNIVVLIHYNMSAFNATAIKYGYGHANSTGMQVCLN